MPTASAAASSKEWLLTGAQLAVLCDISPRQLRDRFSSQIPPNLCVGEGSARRYRTPAVGALWRAMLVGADAETGDDWAKRKMRAQAEHAELDLQIKRGNYCAVAELRAGLDRVAERYRRLGEDLERNCGDLARKLLEAANDECAIELEGGPLSGGTDRVVPEAVGGVGASPPPATSQVAAASNVPRVRRAGNRRSKRAVPGDAVSGGQSAGAPDAAE